MVNLTYRDEDLREILENVATIALVGASPKPDRASYRVMEYLQGKGFRVIPVNPISAGQVILGEKVYSCLKDAPGPFQMVDIFRNSEAAAEISHESILLKDEKGIEVIWMQLEIYHKEAATRAEENGIKVVMDRCPKIEYERLFANKALKKQVS